MAPEPRPRHARPSARGAACLLLGPLLASALTFTDLQLSDDQRTLVPAGTLG